MNATLQQSENAQPDSGIGFRLRKAWFRMRLRLAATWFGRLRFGASRFLYVPPYLRLADPSVAADFLSGQVVLAGRSILAGSRSVFEVAPPSRRFAVALHGFDWLRHFDASGSPEVRAGARRVLGEWLTRREKGRITELAYPEAISRRVIAWVTHSALICEGATLEEYRRLLRQLARDAALLRILATTSGIGLVRLESAIALAYHALALDRPVSAIRQAEAQLLAVVDEAIAPDGGTRDLDPAHAVRVAAELVPLLALYRARQVSTPDAIGVVLARLTTFIRMMQHPDGGLALFNGGGAITRDFVAQATRLGVNHVARLESAPQTGFERLENEHGVLIADTGADAAPGFGGRAGAGTLAFEFSTRTDRLIVNCGLPPSAEGETEFFYRSGPAHSTILLDDAALAGLEPAEDMLGRAGFRVRSDGTGFDPARATIDGNQTLTIGHDGFREARGYVIERSFTLLASGGLAGSDRIIDASGRAETRRLTLVFHLHPRVMPVPLSRQDSIVLRLPHQAPGRDVWLFEAPGFALHLEESRCFEQDTALPKTEAIVLDVPVSGTTEIRWRLLPYLG